MREILFRVELNSLIVILPSINGLRLVKGDPSEEEVNTLILAVDLQTFLAIFLAFFVFPHLVVNLSD